MANITPRVPTSGTATASTGFTVTVPNNSAYGDVLILLVANAGTAGPAVPSADWKSLGTWSAGTGQSLSAYWAYYKSGLTLAWTNSGTDAAWACNSYAGPDVINPSRDGPPIAASSVVSDTALPTGAPTTGVSQAGDYEVLGYAWTSAATISGVASGSTIDKTQANSTTISVALGHNNTNPIAANTQATAFAQTLSAANTRKTGVGILLNVNSNFSILNENELFQEIPLTIIQAKKSGPYDETFPANMAVGVKTVDPGSLVSHRNSHRQ